MTSLIGKTLQVGGALSVLAGIFRLLIEVNAEYGALIASTSAIGLGLLIVFVGYWAVDQESE